MIEVRKGEKIALKFEANFELGAITKVEYRIKKFNGDVVKQGNGNLENNIVYTEPIEFNFDDGLYVLEIWIHSINEKKIIHEFLQVI